MYFHSGRFVSGDLVEADVVARRLATRLGVAVVTPAYSLATERPFPAAAEDAYAALVWAHGNAAQGHWDARRIAVIGDEAGGNLAAVVAMMARDRGGPSIAAQVLIAPMVDPTLSSCSMRSAGEITARCTEAYQRYLPRASDRLHPYAAPAVSTRLAALPPALIITTQDDALRDEAETYATKLIAAGVKTQVTRLPAHGSPEALWREIATFLQPLFAPKSLAARSPLNKGDSSP
jgi:acetyl esterase